MNPNDLQKKLQEFLDKVFAPKVYTYDFKKPASNNVIKPAMAQTPPATPSPQMPQTSPTGDFTPDTIKAGILKWGKGDKSIPILNNVDDLYKAGLAFQKAGLDPYMPTILTLRETQGGRDNTKSPDKYGSNNYTNIRNIKDPNTGAVIGQPGNPKAFINYPSMSVAMLGGQNGANNSAGLVGQVLSSGLYNKYLQSKNLEDFFNTYSNPSDGNGPLPEQVGNYNWFRKQFGEGG